METGLPSSFSSSRLPPRQAVILVGGRGTRLGALAENTPKPLMPIADDQVFLDYLLLNVARHGIKDILLLAGHLSEQIVTRYDGKCILSARVSVVCETVQAGTAGALLGVRDRLDPAFFMLNGDGFLDCNLLALSAAPLEPGGARLWLRKVDNASRYGSVRLEGDRITAFEEKAAIDRAGLINGGVYWMSREVINRIQVLPCSIESEIFPDLAREGLLSGMITDGYFIDIGLPDTLTKARRDLPAIARRRAAFFDRDGTINVDESYTHDPDRLAFIDGAVASIRWFNDAGWYVFVCTNQAGVARGLYDETAVRAFHEAMQQALAEQGAHIDAFYYCPYHEAATIEAYRVVDHPDRKPNPGLLLRAKREWAIQTEGSFMVGDHAKDVAAAVAAGLTGILFQGSNLLRTLNESGVIQRTPAHSESET